MTTAFDFALIRNAWHPGDPWTPDPKTSHYYEVKWDIARRCDPTSILEIGVRAGYSALAFLLACPTATYRGLDANNELWGGGKDFYLHALHILSPYDAVIDVRDSQRIKEPIPGYDFWHIDGDHRFGATLKDLRLARRSGARWILLDDYNLINDVKMAGDAFAHESRHHYRSEYIGDGGYRGNLLFTRS